jgi:hypothetical protein
VKKKSARATSDAPLDRLRKICLALPETTEKESHGRPSFWAYGKIFAMFMDNHHNDGRVAIWCKAPPGARDIVLAAAPHRFFVPPYVGHKGWVGMRLDIDVDWSEVAGIIEDGYRMTTAKQTRSAMGGASLRRKRT